MSLVSEPLTRTFVYKTRPTQNERISYSLDIFLPPSPAKSPLKALVYFHGGGLTAGTRKSWFPIWMHDRAMKANLAFISVDYSLLPPATGHCILEDIIDLFQYLQSTLNKDLERAHCSTKVDPSSIAVAGSSAGGLCAYLAAIHAKPRPKAVLSLYGLGGDFFTSQYLNVKTKPFFIGREMLDTRDFRNFLYPFPPSLSMVSGSPLAYHPADHPTTPGWPSNPRMALCRLLLQEGIFLDYFTGEHEPSFSANCRDLLTELEGEHADAATKEKMLKGLVPSEHKPLFPQFLVDTSFPPTFMLHGERDTAVRIHESKNMKRLLDAHGVRNVLHVADGEEHSFDYAKGATEKYSAIFDEAFEFLLACL